MRSSGFIASISPTRMLFCCRIRPTALMLALRTSLYLEKRTNKFSRQPTQRPRHSSGVVMVVVEPSVGRPLHGVSGNCTRMPLLRCRCQHRSRKPLRCQCRWVAQPNRMHASENCASNAQLVVGRQPQERLPTLNVVVVPLHHFWPHLTTTGSRVTKQRQTTGVKLHTCTTGSLPTTMPAHAHIQRTQIPWQALPTLEQHEGNQMHNERTKPKH